MARTTNIQVNQEYLLLSAQPGEEEAEQQRKKLESKERKQKETRMLASGYRPVEHTRLEHSTCLYFVWGRRKC